MGIFGTTAPRFIFHDGLSDEATVDIDNARLLDAEPETEYVELISELDGSVSFHAPKVSWRVRILVHLFKYGNPSTAYSTFTALKGHFGTLFLHRDGSQFPDASTTFVVKDVSPFFLTTTDFKDAVVLLFESASESIRTFVTSWSTWGQADITPFADTSYTFGDLA